jgi:DNA-binding NarL/FixJ family response regulator
VTLRVVIADRSGLVRMAARSALVADGIDVVAEADDTAAALDAIMAHRPDAVLVDVELVGSSAVLAAARRDLPATAMIALSPDESDARVLAAVSAGACGFVPKDTSPARLPDIVRGAVAGESAIPRRLVRRLLEQIVAADAAQPAKADRRPTAPLTGRERQVLEYLAEGMTDREIGTQLSVSEVTVRRHAAAAAGKLRVGRREDAVAVFRRLVA